MNASGIAVDAALRRRWAALAPAVRFLVLAVRDESIVLDAAADSQGGDLAADLPVLQTLLHDTVPAYVLARLDDPPTHFLAITYVPDAASVRDKMLYASSRAALTRELGAAAFPDALFATSKADLTPAAYAAHRRAAAAPPPLSAREQERAAERAAPAAPSAVSHAPRVQLRWADDAERALAALAAAPHSALVVLAVDPATESIRLVSHAPCAPAAVGAALPPAEPAYAFFAWPERRSTLFIYSCPSASPIRHRMLFSASVASLVPAAGAVLGAPVTKKIETSEPLELDEPFLLAALGASTPAAAAATDEPRPFARPRAPARRSDR